MDHYHYSTVEKKDVTDYGSTHTTIQVLIKPEIAPNFIMRRFEIGPGGNIGVHGHWNEHEIYVIEGEMDLVDKDGKKTHVTNDQFIFMPGDEPRGYENNSDKPVVFLCVVPKKKE
ncbi:MAG: cupin domain-containing protein [Promethearchaeota archaeon]|nr:MAG: cupin domain-containing protein [Candidatus Lokiarchaeota archaeon]